MWVESQAKNTRQKFMVLKKILSFNGSFGITLPKEYCKTLDLHWKDYVEIYFINPDKIVIKKHNLPKEKGININDK
jgi:antitoxin component of MazEF toxin-antitoxin module